MSNGGRWEIQVPIPPRLPWWVYLLPGILVSLGYCSKYNRPEGLTERLYPTWSSPEALPLALLRPLSPLTQPHLPPSFERLHHISEAQHSLGIISFVNISLLLSRVWGCPGEAGIWIQTSVLTHTPAILPSTCPRTCFSKWIFGTMFKWNYGYFQVMGFRIFFYYFLCFFFVSFQFFIRLPLLQKQSDHSFKNWDAFF